MLFITDKTAWVNVRDLEAFERLDDGVSRIHTRNGSSYTVELDAADIAAALAEVTS